MHRAISGWFRRTSTGALALVLALGLVLTLSLAEVPARAAEPYRTRLLELTNRARERRDIRRVKINYRLSRKAKRHSEDMARRRRLFHSSNVGRYLEGIRWSSWAENIGKTSASIRRLQRRFMRSPDHRSHILDRRYKRVGIGVVKARGKFWVTVIFYG